jgi:hypothetical protein
MIGAMMSISTLDGGNRVTQNPCNPEEIDPCPCGECRPSTPQIVDCEIREFLGNFLAGAGL